VGEKYKTKEFTPSLSRMLMAGANREQPIYRWFVYPHSFTKEFVHWAVQQLGLTRGDRVLEPFLGAGTTLLACKELSIVATGFDILPLSILISNVKVGNYRLQTLRQQWSLLKKQSWSTRRRNQIPDIPILSKAFDADVLERIFAIEECVREIENTKYSNFFLVGLLNTIGQLSKAEKGGGWLRLCPDKVVLPEEVDTLFSNSVEKMLSDLESPRYRGPERNWQAYLGDARNLPNNGEFDATISSPPYLNRHDYTRIFSLELAVAFLKTHKQLKELRYRSLRSHVEAKKSFDVQGYSIPSRLAEVLESLEDAPLNNDRILSMVAGYFEDLYGVLKGLYPHIKRGGHVVFVLGNVRFGGVAIPVDEIVAQIGEQAEFEWRKTVVGRLRGNSAQQMGRFGKDPSPESVIIWSK